MSDQHDPSSVITGDTSSSEPIATPSQTSSPDAQHSSDEHSKHKDAAKWVKSVTKDAKTKTRKLLRIDDTKQQLQDDQTSVSHKIQEDPGFNPEATLNAESSTLGQLKDQLPSNFHDLAHIIRHPRAATQGKAERTLATSEEPYLSRSDDEEFLRAHENLEKQSAALPDEEIENGQHWDVVRKTFDDMEDSRESKRVAWTLSRYVHRARVVTPEIYKFPVLSLCRWVDEKGDPQGYKWSQWPHHIRSLLHQAWTNAPSSEPLDETTWHRDLLLQQVERVVMASSPWQKRLSRLRRLWQWEEPKRTGAWFAIWMVVWYNDRVFTFIYCVMAYTIARSREQPERMRILQESHNRIGDENATPDTFGEMINRYGSSDWFDPMIEHIGPHIQPQVKEMADWMEIFMNFYEWKTPRATATLLFVIGCAIAMATFLGTELNMRILTLMTILGFFSDRPISWRVPNYYRVIAPMHWIFWNIPTHIETSFKYLKGQAEKMRNSALEDSPPLVYKNAAAKFEGDNDLQAQSSPGTTTPDKTLSEPIDSRGSYNIFVTSCKWNDITGHIVITFTTIRFIRQFPRKDLWERPFTSLLEIKKGDGKTAIVKRTENFMELTFKDGNVETVEKLEKKDELFNVIVAFSGVTWQQIDP